MLTVHRWLGFSAGIVFAIAAGTGAVLVYADELDAVIGGPRYQTTAGLIEPARIQSAIDSHLPGARLARVIWPSAGPNVLSVRVLADGRQRDLVLDAGSGRVLEPRPQHLLLVGIRRLHAGLLIGTTGGYIVLAASWASLVSLGLGLVLWWPGLRRIASGFSLRLRRSLYVLNLDLHQTMGTLALPLLLVMTVTGVLINPSTMQGLSRVLHGTDFTDDWSSARSSAASMSLNADIDLATAARQAQASAPGAALRQVAFPSATNGVVEVRLRGQMESAGGLAMRLALDRHTGVILRHQQLRYDPETNARLHFGQAGGPVVRALYAIACIVGFSLFPTGVAIWWLRSRPRDVARIRSRGTAALTAPVTSAEASK